MWHELVDAAGYGLWGLLFGFIMSAPVGPVNIIVLQRSLFGRARDGFVIGLGAAFGDLFWAILAVLGLDYISQMVEENAVTFRLVGGAVLSVIAVKIWQAEPHIDRTLILGKVKRTFATTLAVTLANPAILGGFLGFFSAAGIGDLGATGRRPLVDGSMLVLGVFFGAALWWAVFSALGKLLRDKIDDAILRFVNRLSAAAIGVFAVVVAASTLV